jgi:hypothetical protein
VNRLGTDPEGRDRQVVGLARYVTSDVSTAA